MTPLKPPLSIYVVYHPHTPESRELANQLHDWFRLAHDDGDNTEAGLPIWFRARLNNADGPAPAISPEIDWEGAALNVVVILVDDRMVESKPWRAALAGLLKHRDGNLFLPVAVDFSLYRLTFLYEKLQPIRIGEPRDPAEPEKPTEQAAIDARQQRIQQRARLLRRRVTEAIARALRQDDANTAPVPLEVFLSHAKRDGARIAETVRDGLASFSQLRAWYDANELPPGYDWNSPMEDAAERNTAVLLSVVTDAYPTRYWCRQEVNLARMPRSLGLPRPPRISAWTVQPTVAIHQARQWSRPMAQLAQVPRTGWPEREDQIPARVEDIVDRLLLETLLVTFYRRYASRLAEHMAETVAKQDLELVLLTWVPDPWSLTHLSARIRKPLAPEATTNLILAYPGHGLRTAEHRELRDLLGAIFPDQSGPRVHLMSQEALRPGGIRDSAPLKLQVLLSGGGGDEDLEPAGLGPKHLDDLFNRLARRLLQRGCTLAYGGAFGDYKVNLTRALIETARGWVADVQSGQAGEPLHDLEHPPFINYGAWPFYRKIQLWQKADLTGICRFEEIDPPGRERRFLPEESDLGNPDHARLCADALTLMRQHSTGEAQARIVMGGKIRGWSGWLPGIAEEVLCSLARNQLPLILGGFGGCAGLLAEFLGNRNAPWPAELSFHQARQQPSFAVLIARASAARRAVERFAELRDKLQTFRKQLHDDGTDWPFEASRATVLGVLHVRGASSALNHVLDALEEIAGNPSRMPSQQVRP